MAHVMSDVDNRFRVVAPERARRKGEHAFERLLAVAGRGKGDAALVVALLESAADAAERHATLGVLPASEREQWAAVGARFDERARGDNDQVLLGAFGVLLAQSVVGDAAMAERLGVDKSRVSQRVAEGSLYAFVAGDDRCFPLWQLAGGRPLPGLKVVVNVMDPSLHPLSVQHWFTSPNVDLEVDGQPVSPAAWLATGGASQTVAALVADL